jgi:hypothetical protein
LDCMGFPFNLKKPDAHTVPRQRWVRGRSKSTA